jgi:hypothetical protein
LKAVSSLRGLANVLGYQPKSLSYVLYISPTKKYSNFDIPKKNGGVRQIDAPSDELKALQRRLADLLYECTSEIEVSNPSRKAISHGFRRSLSILTNAKPHTNRRYVLNLDLENFFPSIHFGRVRGFFIKNNDFSLHPSVATVIAQIACHNVAPNGLPQGSPCSPIISDLIAHVMDVRLVRLAKAHKCTYSRYADDLTFSTNQKQFPAALATFAPASSQWTLGQPLVDRISSANFSVNNSKTRMQCETSRQVVTGLSVNKKVNIRSDYYRHARSMCNSLFSKGEYFRPDSPHQPIASLLPLEGIMNHVHFVKDTADHRASADKKIEPSAIRALYKRLLFFKYFVLLDRPLILCEGKTDQVYIRSAIHKLVGSFPQLADLKGKVVNSKVRFFSYSNLSHLILQLGGGTSEILFFIRDYGDAIKKYKFAPLAHPVIILIDNDDGAKGIFGLINNKFNQNASLTSVVPFYRLTHNLYLVKTPEQGAKGMSMIEDCFKSSFLTSTFAGKTLNKSNAPSTANQIGKAAFAEIVRTNANTIDFSGFSPLLARIVAVLNDYKPPVAKTTP